MQSVLDISITPHLWKIKAAMQNALSRLHLPARATALRWASKGFWAIADQGLFSGANFIINILLARWLGPEDYGAFAVAFAIFLFLSGFHNALLLEPMSVIGPTRYSNQIGAYLSTQVGLHFALTFPIAILTFLTGILMQAAGIGNPSLAWALIGSGVALPFILLLWMTRRMFYLLRRPAGAFLSSLFYALFLIAGMWGLRIKHLDSSLTAFAWMGITCLLISVVAGNWLLYKEKREVRLAWKEILPQHWDYGKWVLAASVLYLFAGQLQTFFLAGLLDLESAGAFRAMQNFSLPMTQTITAISTLGLPGLAYEYGQGNLHSMRRKGFFITLSLILVAIAYEIFLWALAAPLERWIYGGKYADYASAIPLLGLVPVFTALATGFSLLLRAVQKSEIYLISGVITFTVGLITTLTFIPLWGVTGAAGSLAVTHFAGSAGTVYMYKIWFPKKRMEN